MSKPYLYASQFYGLKEVPGKKSNKKLIQLIKTIIPWADDDSTIAWCAIFMAYVFKKLGYQLPSHPAAARSWLNLPNSKTIWKDGDKYSDIGLKAQVGDIVVF